MIEALIAAGVLGAAAILYVLARAMQRPNSFSYDRSVVVKAPAERIFPLIADLATFNSWNPFNEDPSIKGSYGGHTRGPGARYVFESRRAGTGHIDVIEDQPPNQVVMRLVMTRPMVCDNRVEFRLEPVGEETRVTWSMTGAVSFTGKIVNQLMDCDAMCGRQFDKGLAKLKAIAEGTTERAAPEPV